MEDALFALRNGLVGTLMISIAALGPMWLCYSAAAFWLVSLFVPKLIQPVMETIDDDQ